MAALALRRDESLGLGLAVIGHAALLLWLVWQRAPAPLPLPERMEVTISDETGPISTSPEPQAAPLSDKGPVFGEAPPPSVPAPEPAPIVKPESVPPRPVPAPAPKTSVKPTTPTATAKPAQSPPKTLSRTAAISGASAFDRNFGNGIPATVPGNSKNPPAQATGTQKERWKSQIVSKIVSRFGACAVPGLDVDKLYFDVRFTLTIEGQIESSGQVQVGGINDANRAQVEPLKACALKAVRQATPHTGLPPEFYNDWKTRNVRLRVKD